jgi:hypothetical protein
MDINVIGRSLWLMSNLTGHYRHSPANNVIGRIIVFVRNNSIRYVAIDDVSYREKCILWET